MQQYLDLLKEIKEKGTWKDAARENMPRTLSLFGYQFRHSLQDGFPLLTTKKTSFKNIAVELLWFLRGDTNIKYLIDNGCNIWNEDSYNYYLKEHKKYQSAIPEESRESRPMTFDEFISILKNDEHQKCEIESGEILGLGWGGMNINSHHIGDCGKMYGWLWRNWKGYNLHPAEVEFNELAGNIELLKTNEIDQFEELINGLKKNPSSRRHIITAWNPATLEDMALNACHAFVQFNCRPIPWEEKLEMAKRHPNVDMENLAITEAAAGNPNFGPIPQYHLDCQLYQRSADVVLGVPFNIASYGLLTHIVAKICNMIPGDFIHTFGDVHIYENHMDAVNTQLEREPKKLPNLVIDKEYDWNEELDGIISGLTYKTFQLENYDPYPKIEAELSTGLKK